MIKVDIPPLSVNKAWQGKRFKTKDYQTYQKTVLILLPKIKLPEAPYKISFEFGFSNKASDLDNPAKLLIDIMQKKYNFDDKEVYELNIKKVIIKKGAEYFSFKIESVEHP